MNKCPICGNELTNQSYKSYEVALCESCGYHKTYTPSQGTREVLDPYGIILVKEITNQNDLHCIPIIDRHHLNQILKSLNQRRADFSRYELSKCIEGKIVVECL